MYRKVGLLVVWVALLAALLVGCSWQGAALLPQVPTRAAPVVVATPTLAATEVAATATSQPQPEATPAVVTEPLLVARVETQAYTGPGRHYEALHVLGPGSRMRLLGRLADNSWLAIAGPGDGPGAFAWVAAEDVAIEGDALRAPVLPMPEVEAAVFPIVDAETGFLLGGWANGWLDPAETVARLGALPYRLYVDSRPAGALEGRPFAAAGGPCPIPIVQFDEVIPGGAVALLAAATWAPDARPVREMAATEPLRAQVARLLAEQGIASPEVRIDQVLRVDLEGDELDELLITATRLGDGSAGRAVNAGDYALVALQPAVGGSLVPLALEVYLEAAEQAFPYAPVVTGVLDVNGDGRMEIVVRQQRHEGLQVTLFEASLPLLTAGCHL
jgi:hypothetical protein